MVRMLSRHHLTGLRRALTGLVALVLLVTALGAGMAPAHAHGAGRTPVSVSATSGEHGGTGGKAARHDACHGLRCACHGGTCPDTVAGLSHPLVARILPRLLGLEPVLTSRQDAPPLQPPRA
ncbi:hypothetical protein JMJ55_06575 [Belnapia sp. T6]|uniref:Secreted protein n=1 Tax=Belnapia mucosa TaxID=2804532 RepID=A0ABS1UZU5_9PROT|nr:hypothetical protein [Belnapia mucosa]MBL6454981.1 hypothetical protein [Belnapia mucosa]